MAWLIMNFSPQKLWYSSPNRKEMGLCEWESTWSLSRMSMPVGPCLYTWLMVPGGRLHTHAIFRISSTAVSSSRYRAWYTAHKKHMLIFTHCDTQIDKQQFYTAVKEELCAPCKLEEMLCSPFSLVLCPSSRGLSWQTYTVNLGLTDLHTQIWNMKSAGTSIMVIQVTMANTDTHLDLSALKSLIPSAGPQIWTRSSLVSFNKSEPTQ